MYRFQKEKDLLEVAASLVKKKEHQSRNSDEQEKAITTDALRNKYKV